MKRIIAVMVACLVVSGAFAQRGGKKVKEGKEDVKSYKVYQAEYKKSKKHNRQRRMAGGYTTSGSWRRTNYKVSASCYLGGWDSGSSDYTCPRFNMTGGPYQNVNYSTARNAQ